MLDDPLKTEDVEVTDDAGLMLGDEGATPEDAELNDTMELGLVAVEEAEEVKAELDCAKVGLAMTARKRTMPVIFMTTRVNLGDS